MSEADGRVRTGRSRWLWVGYWAALFVATHVPVPSGSQLPLKHGDKLVHFGLYFVLALIGGRVLRSTNRGTLRMKLSLWAAIYVAYAAADEYTQAFVGRTGSWSDWLFDVIGVVTATAVLLLTRTR